MKFSESWLRESVDPAISTAELVEQLTMAGLEVEGTEPVAAVFDGIVVAEVTAVVPHPNADKLRVCTVNAGGEPLQVVCGAPNVEAGGRFPLATVGGKLDGEKIRKAKLRGVESFGMLCSERELGISDKHEGLLRLPDDAPVGVSVIEYLHLDDVIIELDLTPNRSDCLGMVGLARETGVLNGVKVKDLIVEPVPAMTERTHEVSVVATDACPRYVGRVIEDVDPGAATPLWMSERLRRAGLRSIDPIVDVTNFVMLETGQPLHAFDLDRVEGPIGVRLSEAGESFTLLDGSTVELDNKTLLIVDDAGPLGMAGVMGGLRTAVSAGTRRIFLESAFFAPVAIAGRARHYGMSTDAAHRFERGVDWAQQRRAIERATGLLLDIAGGRAGPVTEAVSDPHLPRPATITLRQQRVSGILGVAIDAAETEQILERLGCAVVAAGSEGEWQVTSPSHRFDMSIEEDLIEELGRVYGYNRLPSVTPTAILQMAPVTETVLPLRKLREQLVARGYQEAITYSFVDDETQRLLDPGEEPIGLANPISSELAVMRTTLWSGLIRALQYNRNRQQPRVRLFETGLRFQQPANQEHLDLALVRQEKMLAGVATGPRSGENWANSADLMDFFDLKGDLESVFARTGDPDSFVFEAGEHPALHSGQCARITRGGSLAGFAGMLDPRVQEALSLSEPVFLFELVVDVLCDRVIPRYTELSRFPEVRRDIAVMLPLEVTAKNLRECVESAGVERLVNLKLFDVYHGKGIDPTRKSVALGLTFQHPSRTLTDIEVSDSVDRIVVSLTDRVGASLRN